MPKLLGTTVLGYRLGEGRDFFHGCTASFRTMVINPAHCRTIQELLKHMDGGTSPQTYRILQIRILNYSHTMVELLPNVLHRAGISSKFLDCPINHLAVESSLPSLGLLLSSYAFSLISLSSSSILSLPGKSQTAAFTDGRPNCA